MHDWSHNTQHTGHLLSRFYEIIASVSQGVNHNLYGVYIMIWCIWWCSGNNSYPSIFMYMIALFYSLIFVLWSPLSNGPYRCSLVRIGGDSNSTDPGPGLTGVLVPLEHTGAFCGWAASWAADMAGNKGQPSKARKKRQAKSGKCSKSKPSHKKTNEFSSELYYHPWPGFFKQKSHQTIDLTYSHAREFRQRELCMPWWPVRLSITIQ